MMDLLKELPAPVIAQLQLTILVLARIFPIIAFTPVFGGELISRRFRVGLSLLLAVALSGIVESGPVMTSTTWLLLLAKEFMFGGVIAVFVLVVFQSLTAAGAIIDLARGASMATMLEPLTKQQNSVMGVFLLQLGVVAFVSAGGYGLLVEAFARSLTVLHPASPLPDALLDQRGLTSLIGLGGVLLSTAVRFAAPVIALTFLIDLSLATLGRFAPQVQVFFLGHTLKAWLGIFATLLALTAIGELLASTIRSVPTAVNGLVGAS
jgi:flagellar biosynthesis protein FliR